MATINYDYYAGMDAYSDGDIENTLLKIVEHGKELEDLRDEEISYPVLYHLSHLRENIINWYPIEPDQSVLEIGSGCGAITSILCKKARRVVSVELSKRRALINYTRNQEKSNLEIIVGNLNDIDFKEKFDYVILNGVFEYAISFFDDEEPYIKLLNLCKDRLTESGKVLIAIENRLGIKYFTGAPEDHTKNYYLGLNEYKGNESVRTFSKSEWKKILKKCGLGCKFYYPYPDYKFPEEIYTDESLKSGMYGKPYMNYDSERFEWINEHQMTKTLMEEDVMASFSNSFFVEAAVNDCFTDIEYSKMSCDRKRDCRIVTVIHNKNGNKWVEKFAADEAAGRHIRKLQENSHAVGKNQRIICLPGKDIDGKIVFEYLTGRSLEKEILMVSDETGKKEIFRMLKDFFETYFSEFDVQEFVAGKEFRDVFGEFEGKKSYRGIKGGNLDLVLDNVFSIKGQYYIIDCEWIFDFVMPIKFIIWRSLNDFCVKHEEIKDIFIKNELFDYFGIEDEDISLFEKWNVHFAYQWLRANMTERFRRPISYVSMDYMTGLFRRENRLSCSLYYDCGEGYREENKLFAKVNLKEHYFEVCFDLSGMDGIRRLRFDPIEGHACRCRLKKNDLNLLPLNAYENEEGWDVFLTDDPIYEAQTEENSRHNRVVISGEIVVTDFCVWYRQLREIYETKLDMYQRENGRLRIEAQEKREQNEILQNEMSRTQNELQQTQEVLRHTNDILDSIYNSKGWKALSFVKRIVKHEKKN